MYDALVAARHNGYKPEDKHQTDLNADGLQNCVFDAKYVRSSRVRTGRSIRGLGLPTHCTRAERREVEKILSEACGKLTGPLAGKYESLKDMSEERQDQLIGEHLLYDKPVSPPIAPEQSAE